MRSVVGLFDRFDDAMQAVRALTDTGIRREDISVMANDQRGEYSRYLEENPETGAENVASGAATGAGIGAVLGGMGGLLIGLGALAIPGIGPVLAAGPLAAALAGAGIGAAAGGVLGALIDIGIPEEQAHIYAEGVRRGGTLVIARVDDTIVNRTVEVMNRFNPVDINERSVTWRQENWTGFDPESKPYTSEDYDLERARYGQESVPVTGPFDQPRTPLVEEDVMSGDWSRYDLMYQQDFQTRFGTTGRDYSYYQPAYRYGYDLRMNPRYNDYDWSRLEPEARAEWQRRGERSMWEEVRDAVRHAWDSIRY